MTLTVPQAGTIGGRAAQPQVADAPQYGAALSDLGNKMADLGTQWKAQDISLMAQRTTLDMTKDLALARQDVAQIADPAAMTQAWAAKEAEIKAKYLADPNMDPALQTQLDLNWQDLTTKHAVDLSGTVIALRQSQHVAAYTTQSTAIDAMVPGADPATFAALRTQKMAAIDALAGTPGYDPAKIAELKVQADQQMFGERATAAITADPAAFLAENAAKDSPYAALGDKRGDFERAAQAQLAQNAKAAQTEADRTRAQLVKANNDQLDGMISLSAKNISPAQQQLLDDPNFVANADPAKVAQAKTAVQLVNDMPTIAQMTLPELDQAIATEKAQPKTEGYQADRLALMQKLRDDKAAALAKDAAGVAQAAKQGFDPLPLDPQHLADLAPALGARLTDAAHLSSVEGMQVNPLTLQEQQQLKTIVDPKADVQAKLALVTAFAKTGPANWQQAAASIGMTDAQKGALFIMANTGDAGLVESLLRGEQKVAANVSSAPPGPQAEMIFADLTQGIFGKDPATAGMLLAAATAAYVDTAPPTDPTAGTATSFGNDSDKVKAFSTAVQRVMGATPDANGKLSVGGIQEIHGAPVLLPPGVPRDQVAATLDQLQLFAGGRFTFSEQATSPAFTQAFTAASVDQKTTPDFGDNPQMYLGQAALIPVPGKAGFYTMQISNNGRPYTFPTKEDPSKAYTFRLTDLIRETGSLMPTAGLPVAP